MLCVEKCLGKVNRKISYKYTNICSKSPFHPCTNRMLESTKAVIRIFLVLKKLLCMLKTGLICRLKAELLGSGHTV